MPETSADSDAVQRLAASFILSKSPWRWTVTGGGMSPREIRSKCSAVAWMGPREGVHDAVHAVERVAEVGHHPLRLGARVDLAAVHRRGQPVDLRAQRGDAAPHVARQQRRAHRCGPEHAQEDDQGAEAEVVQRLLHLPGGHVHAHQEAVSALARGQEDRAERAVLVGVGVEGGLARVERRAHGGRRLLVGLEGSVVAVLLQLALVGAGRGEGEAAVRQPHHRVEVLHAQAIAQLGQLDHQRPVGCVALRLGPQVARVHGPGPVLHHAGDGDQPVIQRRQHQARAGHVVLDREAGREQEGHQQQAGQELA
ncbi:MAG: hypothetical protein QM767_24450 [Anaeromyxobacter sp.]